MRESEAWCEMDRAGLDRVAVDAASMEESEGMPAGGGAVAKMTGGC